jgi:hypothetical protein
MVEQPGQRGVARCRAVFVAGPAGGVATDEVVEDVPARRHLPQEVLGAQLLQVPADAVEVGAGEGGGGVGVDVATGVQGQQPEQPPAVGGQVPVGQVERELDTGVEPVGAVAFVEPVGVIGDRPVGFGPHVPRDQTEGQR